MTNLPSKVSIIVPVYNVENYLAKCLDSLVNQSLQDIEILVIDDGSKDKSGDIIEQYAGKYPEKIKAFTKENGGLSDARNYGIDRATGEYIGFVDSDDYVAETMFEEMFLLAEKYHTKMVISNIQKVDEHGNITQKLTQIPNMPELIDLNEHFSVFSDLSYFACNKLFKKEIFDHKRFKKGVHFEDIQLIPQLLLKCDQIAQTQNFHYQYLERSDSITKTHTEKGLDILKAVADVEQVFYTSDYAHKKKELKNFQIFEGVYSFLAYLALTYSRFGKNYLLYLPLKKKIFYLLLFAGQQKLIRKLM